jgi:hypothetical protein
MKLAYLSAMCIVVIVISFMAVIIFPQQVQKFSQEISTSIHGKPPDVSVSLSASDAYLGDYPRFTFTVTNNGGSCVVNYTIFETQPQTGTFNLNEGEVRTVTVTGPQVRDVGAYSTSIRITATNSFGSDFDQATTSFDVFVKPFDPRPYIDQNELRLAETNLYQIIGQLLNVVSAMGSAAGLNIMADSYLPLTYRTSSITAIAQALKNRHPNDLELQAKEIYYWVANWITYDKTPGPLNLDYIANQAKFPIQTINSRSGICINYALTLATLYEAAGFNSELLLVWNSLSSPGHALVLLHYPNLSYGYYPFGDDRMILDPTLGSTAGWKFGEYHTQGWKNYDTADV